MNDLQIYDLTEIHRSTQPAYILERCDLPMNLSALENWSKLFFLQRSRRSTPLNLAASQLFQVNVSALRHKHQTEPPRR